jgi:creatinine amidohydrolase/Fe(II)-dependent formamide hydrolase-like protein
MYAREEIFALTVRELLRMALNFGFRQVVIVSGHAAENHLRVLERLVEEFNATRQAKFLLVLSFVTNQQGIMEVGHASKIETSVTMALQPQTVDIGRLPPESEPLRNIDYAIVDYNTFLGHPTSDHTVSRDDDPRHATAEIGQMTIQNAVAEIVRKVNLITTNNSQEGG